MAHGSYAVRGVIILRHADHPSERRSPDFRSSEMGFRLFEGLYLVEEVPETNVLLTDTPAIV